MVTEKKIPNYFIEDRIFARRLQRNLNDELERLYRLLVEQVRLLKERTALMADISEAVQRRWKEEEKAESNIHSVLMTEEDADAD
jgi:hypothetical protein